MKITYKKLTERDNFVFSWKAAHRKNGREGVQRRERECKRGKGKEKKKIKINGEEGGS